MDLTTGIGRQLDIDHASNRFVVTVSVIAGTIAGAIALLDGDGLPAALWAGVLAGGAAFLAWAIARELDPDDATSANLAAVAGFAVALIGDPFLAAAGAVLLAARIVARTTGIPPQPIDLLVLVGFAAYLGSRPAGLIAAMAIGVALVADRMLPGRTPAANLLGGVLAIAAAATVAAVAGEWPEWTAPGTAGLAVAALGLAGALVSFTIPEPDSTADAHDRRLHHIRMQWARVLAVATGLGYVAIGKPGILGLGPLWAAFAAVGLVTVLRRARRLSAA